MGAPANIGQAAPEARAEIASPTRDAASPATPPPASRA
ncbi:unnamed protein product [Ciceribacter sp. T2.26MG-112.2]|nr:unnamed protein product [Ciceribacter naphthalenivorans]